MCRVGGICRRDAARDRRSEHELGPARPDLEADNAPFPCGRLGTLCYLPQDIQQAYNFPTGPGAPTGAGQTILIVTAYGAPYLQPLLQTFDAAVGLPDPPSFTIYNQQTPVPGTIGSGATFHWQVETALDVEWAHAMAPGANIVVGVSATDDTADVAQLLQRGAAQVSWRDRLPELRRRRDRPGERSG